MGFIQIQCEGDIMEFKSTMKKGAIVAALGLSLSTFAAIPANAAGNTNPHAQKLVEALQALNINQVDYLYAYLQSITLSDAEYNGILDNAKRASQILKGQNLETLANAQKVEVVRLFLESVKLAHLQASVVDEKGNSIDLLNYKAGSAKLVIQLKDLKGNVLATLDPKKSDLDPKVFQAKINALETAVKEKKQLDKSGTFVPMPAGSLPKTATSNPDYILLGVLLMLMSGAAAVPAVRLVRKSKDLVEA